MEFLYAFMILCVIELPCFFCLQDASQSQSETIVEMLKKLEKDLDEAKQQIQTLQSERNKSCKLEQSVHGSNLKRSFLPGSAVGFTACVSLPDLQNLGVHHTIRFDRTITNSGGAYHNSTGVFTAPYKGLYVIAVSAMSSPGRYQYLQLVKDGVLVNTLLADARGEQSFEVTGNQWVLELNQGSEVWIQTQHAGEIHGNCFTLFSGFLLSETE